MLRVHSACIHSIKSSVLFILIHPFSNSCDRLYIYEGRAVTTPKLTHNGSRILQTKTMRRVQLIPDIGEVCNLASRMAVGFSLGCVGSVENSRMKSAGAVSSTPM